MKKSFLSFGVSCLESVTSADAVVWLWYCSLACCQKVRNGTVITLCTFGVLAQSLQQLERKYSITFFSRTLELQKEIANVSMSVVSVSWHTTSFHIVKDSSPGVLYQTFSANISHQVSMLLPCSRNCGKGKVQVNGLLPKSKVFCSWVYQNMNVATTSKWRNYMPYMEVYVEGLSSRDFCQRDRSHLSFSTFQLWFSFCS